MYCALSVSVASVLECIFREKLSADVLVCTVRDECFGSPSVNHGFSLTSSSVTQRRKDASPFVHLNIENKATFPFYCTSDPHRNVVKQAFHW